MGCKKNTIKFAKHVWAVLGPGLSPHVARLVALVNEIAPMVPDLLDSGSKKRRFVVNNALTKAKEIGHDAFDDAKEITVSELKDAIRTQMLRSVYLLNGAHEGWQDTIDMADENEPISV